MLIFVAISLVMDIFIFNLIDSNYDFYDNEGKINIPSILILESISFCFRFTLLIDNSIIQKLFISVYSFPLSTEI